MKPTNLLVESEQTATCAECGRMRKVYAVGLVSIYNDNADKIREEWRPVCEECRKQRLAWMGIK